MTAHNVPADAADTSHDREAVDDRCGWVHVSTHSGACPQSFAQPAEPDRAAPLTQTLELVRIVERMLTEQDEAAKSEQEREQLG
jgi:hypothetical protein